MVQRALFSDMFVSFSPLILNIKGYLSVQMVLQLRPIVNLTPDLLLMSLLVSMLDAVLGVLAICYLGYPLFLIVSPESIVRMCFTVTAED